CLFCCSYFQGSHPEGIPFMSEASSLPSIRPVCAGIVLILGILLSGCGTKTYEDRLKLTETYYDYIERLNRNLGPQFNDSGIQFRVPVQFQQIPAPVRKSKAATEGADEAAEDEEDQIDPRQPEHLGFQLPGLIAAWKA